MLSIAEVIGFSGNRQHGLSLLHQSAAGTSFIAPFACLLLLMYYVTITAFLGEQSDVALRQAKLLIEWGKPRFPDSVFFGLMESRWCRCSRQLREAIDIADAALPRCTNEMSSNTILFHHQKAWCAFFLLEWTEAAEYFGALMPIVPGAGQNSSVTTHASTLASFLFAGFLCVV